MTGRTVASAEMNDIVRQRAIDMLALLGQSLLFLSRRMPASHVLPKKAVESQVDRRKAEKELCKMGEST